MEVSKKNYKYSSYELTEGLLSGDKKVVSYLYRLVYPKIISYILSNSGTKKDAEDAVQNALLTAFNNIKQGKYKDSGVPADYIAGIARNHWLKKLRKRQPESSIDSVQIPQKETENTSAYAFDLQEEVYKRSFAKLDKVCAIVLRMYYDKLPFKKVAQYLGLKNANQAKKKKYRCKLKLEKIVKQDELYPKLEKILRDE